jgi:hypothetical protein
VGLAMLAAGMALALGWRIGWRVVPPSTEVS